MSKCLSRVSASSFCSPSKQETHLTFCYHPGTVEVGDPPGGCHSGTLLHLGTCSGLEHPGEVSPAWRQPCGVLVTEEEGPPQLGPSLHGVMTTSEEPCPAQPGGTSEPR